MQTPFILRRADLLFERKPALCGCVLQPGQTFSCEMRIAVERA